MKKIILASAALAFSAGLAFADGHAKTIRLGTEGAYPPYNFLNDKGEVDGFERELGDELCKRAELTCEWVTNEWDSIIPNKSLMMQTRVKHLASFCTDVLPMCLFVEKAPHKCALLLKCCRE